LAITPTFLAREMLAIFGLMPWPELIISKVLPDAPLISRSNIQILREGRALLDEAEARLGPIAHPFARTTLRCLSDARA
jgi:hypothetical protein